MFGSLGSVFESWKYFWILRSVLGFWEGFINSGTCFVPTSHRTTTWNFQKLLSYMSFGGNVVCVLFLFFFFTAPHFHLAFAAASISRVVTAATNFQVVLPTKKCLLYRCCCFCFVLISRFRSMSAFLSLTFAGLQTTFSFSLSFSCSIFQVSGNDN